MCCAPIVFNILLEAKPHERREITTPVQILTGGSPPAAALLEKIEAVGFHVVSYGSTEAARSLVCEWQAKWNNLPAGDQAKLKARQGVSTLEFADADFKDLATMESVPRDGKTMGEIVLRGSSIMKGYFEGQSSDRKERSTRVGSPRGMLGVIHLDGHLEIKDRSKDVIISGGENISSVEVESVLYKHPCVAEASVVAMPHPRWGESPCAFVKLVKTSNSSVRNASEADIIAYCRKNLPAKEGRIHGGIAQDFNWENSKVPTQITGQNFCRIHLSKKSLIRFVVVDRTIMNLENIF